MDELLDYGFNEEDASFALATCGGNFERALNMLLTQQENFEEIMDSKQIDDDELEQLRAIGFFDQEGPSSATKAPAIVSDNHHALNLVEFGQLNHSMHLLKKLYESTSFNVLTKWTTTRDLAKFDSACCNAADRQFLSQRIFKSPNYPIIQNNPTPCHFFLDWVISRQIKLEQLHIGWSKIAQVEQLTQLDMSEVKTILIGGKEKYSKSETRFIIDAINRTEKLTNLEMTYAYSYLLEGINESNIIFPWILERLTQLSLTIHNQTDILTPESIYHLAQHCVSLQTFVLDTDEMGITSTQIRHILEKNRNITLLELNYCDLKMRAILIPTIALLLPQLVTLRTYTSSNIDYKALANLFTQCVHLQTVHIALEVTFGVVSDYFTMETVKSDTANNNNASSNCENNTKNELNNSLTYTRKMKTRCANNKNKADLLTLLKVCENLSEIILDSALVTDEMVRVIADQNCATLQTIDFESCGSGYTCDLLKYLLTKCNAKNNKESKLHSIRLNNCNHLPNDEIVTLFCTVPNNLLSISIDHHNTITTSNCCDILSGNLQLKEVWFYGCPLVRTEGIRDYLVDNERTDVRYTGKQ